MMKSYENFKEEDIFLIDFGFSARYKTNPNFQMDEKIGTLLFMAPEQISLSKYGRVMF